MNLDHPLAKHIVWAFGLLAVAVLASIVGLTLTGHQDMAQGIGLGAALLTAGAGVMAFFLALAFLA